MPPLSRRVIGCIALFGLSVFLQAQQPFPEPYNSEPSKEKPYAPDKAAATMKLPAGFSVSVFAQEPQVRNPIAATWDFHGRLWVAENYTYAERPKRFDLDLRDRILIFEDKNGDGKAEEAKVFTDKLTMLTSLEVDRQGVWALCPPQLFFIPDADHNGVPDADPEVVLDGFTVGKDNYHNFANGLKIGPDGWLYGRCGASCPGDLGLPGTPETARVPLRGGMWRYHPKRKVVEVLNFGTTNPWGHDWNETGDCFFINTVNGHLWHSIAGAHFQRPHSIDPFPRTYVLIDQHADHYHFDTKKSWTESRDGKANDLGGGHAHSGCLIYQGEQFPPEYRGKLMTLNFHGRRINIEKLERQGTGYVAKHEPDFCLVEDPWFRGIDLFEGPDGSVFILDWSDTGECHENNGVHRQSGRIYQLSYGKPNYAYKPDIAKLNQAEFQQALFSKNHWLRTKARQWIGQGSDSKEWSAFLLPIAFEQQRPVIDRLQAIWTLHQLQVLSTPSILKLLEDKDETIRSWGVRLLTDGMPIDTVDANNPRGIDRKDLPKELLATLIQLAKTDPSGLVRLQLASSLQRIPYKQRIPIVAELLDRVEDAQDHNQPLMLWYATMRIGEMDLASLPQLTTRADIPLTRRLIARRIAEGLEKNPAPLNALLVQLTAQKTDQLLMQDILEGVVQGLAGYQKLTPPPAWNQLQKQLNAFSNVAIQESMRDLGVIFGDGRSMESVVQVVKDTKADPAKRQRALQTLIEAKPANLQELCEQFIGDRALAVVAVRGLSRFEDVKIGKKLAERYRSFHPTDRPEVLAVLLSRATWAAEVLEALTKDRIPKLDVQATHARQILSFNKPELTAKLKEVWGEIRTTDVNRTAVIRDWKAKLEKMDLAKVDFAAGKQLYTQRCATCHQLYGEGAKLGPDLTGSGRQNLDYLLENLFDPSGVVSAEYRLTTIDTKDGRSLAGLVTSKTERIISLRTLLESHTIPLDQIEEIRASAQSFMPEGLVDGLSESDVANLIGYLMRK